MEDEVLNWDAEADAIKIAVMVIEMSQGGPLSRWTYLVEGVVGQLHGVVGLGGRDVAFQGGWPAKMKLLAESESWRWLRDVWI